MARTIKTDKKVNAAFTLDPKVISIIDRERGKISRSEFVNNLILELFDE